MQPNRICTWPGCNALTTKSRCPKHKYILERKSSHERGYNHLWTRLRNVYIRNNPICEIRQKCIGAPAVEVDHITPISSGGAVLDQDNLQSTCKRCHVWKTRTVDYAEPYQF